MSHPFIIWTMQRTGGTSLTDLLMDMSEHKSADHEPFNWERDPRQFASVAESWNKSRDAAALAKQLNNILSSKYLIKHCYEFHPMEFNKNLMAAAAKTKYRHILLLRRDELSRLFSRFVAQTNGTWFRDYASKVFAEVAVGQRRIGPLPVDEVVAQYQHCRQGTDKIRSFIADFKVECLDVFFEDIYVGPNDDRLIRLNELFDFLGFSAKTIDTYRPIIEAKIFEGGQNTRSVARFVPNLRDVVKALVSAGCPAPPEGLEAWASGTGWGGPNARIAGLFQELAEAHKATGPFLEIGVTPGIPALLSADFFSGAERHVLTTDKTMAISGITMHYGDTNDMPALFQEGSFATVISNNSLSSDRYFLRTVEEMKRVLAPGGLLMVSAHSFSKPANHPSSKVIGPKGNTIADATITHRISNTPDFWRISPQAMRQVILDGLDIREVRETMIPPRLFGVATKLAEPLKIT